MFRKSIAFIALGACLVGGGISLPTGADAAGRISMEQAKDRCFARVKRFASEGVGPNSRERSQYEIRAAYKRCIYGYTGQEAKTIPNFRRS